MSSTPRQVSPDEPISIGSRLEPLIDDLLIDELSGGELRLHRPTPKEVAIVFDAPWEGNTSAYVTVFQDGPIYRMYYRGANYDLATDTSSEQVICKKGCTDAALTRHLGSAQK